MNRSDLCVLVPDKLGGLNGSMHHLLKVPAQGLKQLRIVRVESGPLDSPKWAESSFPDSTTRQFLLG
jgi:hypothetical protein